MFINHLSKSSTNHILRTKSIASKSLFQQESFTKGNSKELSRIQQHRNKFEAIKSQLSINGYDDWYNISHADLVKHGAARLLKSYKSLYDAFSKIYPEHEWHAWKFARVPDGFWKDINNQKSFFDFVAKEHKLETPIDWFHKVSLSNIKKLGGGNLMQTYNNNLQRALSTVYPQYQWNSIKDRQPDTLAKIREQYDRLAKKLGLTTWEGWYTVKLDDLIDLEEDTFLSHYNYNLSRLLLDIYPEHPWVVNRLPNRIVGHWESVANQRNHFDSIAREQRFQSLNDWYSFDVLSDARTRQIVSQYYNGNLVKLFSTLYPDQQWDTFLFKKLPKGFWKDVNNQRKFFDRLVHKLGISLPNDWKKITLKDIHANGGMTLIKNYYNTSIIRALSTIYPEFSWGDEKLVNWKDISVQRGYFDKLGKKLGVLSMDDWYRITGSQIPDDGGSYILKYYYGGSLFKALRVIYPDHVWQPWHFAQTSKVVWREKDIIESYVDYLTDKLRIRSLDDWYRISQDQIRSLGGYNIIERHGGLYKTLKLVYPNHSWVETKFIDRGKKASQRWLKVVLEDIFPESEIFEDYLHPNLKNLSNEQLELDLFIPSLKLAFEYQGKHHYSDIHYFGAQNKYQERDDYKRIACEEVGIRLIHIPYWWDNKKDSLAATISNKCPELRIYNGGTPIPTEQPT